MRVYYFGPWDQAGHHLRDENGYSAYKAEAAIPWTLYELDGRMQPHKTGCRKGNYCGCTGGPEGVALVHHRNGWTALSFWDRSVDTRGASNSTYIAEGAAFSFEEMVQIASERFAYRWKKMNFPITEAHQDSGAAQEE